mgnify:CR=1 FL=1
MALTAAQRQIIADAIRANIIWDGEGPDRRTLADLRRAFERRHLGGLVRSYQKSQAEKTLELIDLDAL